MNRIIAHNTPPVAGFLATAVAFGPARMGFGLFLPNFRESFDLSTELAGLIASAAFGAFLLALPAAAYLLNRRGPRAPIVIGGAAAAVGLMMAAVAQSVWMLAAGVIVAGASGGFVWTPFNNAVERMISKDRRTRSLSIISSGTTVGVAAAGALAIAVSLSGFDWRAVWNVFAVFAIVVILVNLSALRTIAGDPGADPGEWRDLKRPEIVPLIIAAFSFGVTSAVYISFAVDIATTNGAAAFGPLDSAAPLIFIVFGVVGLAGLLTGEVETRIGLVALMRAIFVASAASFMLLAFAPGEHWAVLISAGLQGAVVMMISAALSFWSVRLFPHMPSISFTGVLIIVGLGSVVGPAAAGWAAGLIGLEAVFGLVGVVSLLTPVGLRSRLVERASARPWQPGDRSRTVSPAPE